MASKTLSVHFSEEALAAIGRDTPLSARVNQVILRYSMIMAKETEEIVELLPAVHLQALRREFSLMGQTSVRDVDECIDGLRDRLGWLRIDCTLDELTTRQRVALVELLEATSHLAR